MELHCKAVKTFHQPPDWPRDPVQHASGPPRPSPVLQMPVPLLTPNSSFRSTYCSQGEPPAVSQIAWFFAKASKNLSLPIRNACFCLSDVCPLFFPFCAARSAALGSFFSSLSFHPGLAAGRKSPGLEAHVVFHRPATGVSGHPSLSLCRQK